MANKQVGAVRHATVTVGCHEVELTESEARRLRDALTAALGDEEVSLPGLRARYETAGGPPASYTGRSISELRSLAPTAPMTHDLRACGG